MRGEEMCPLFFYHVFFEMHVKTHGFRQIDPPMATKFKSRPMLNMRRRRKVFFESERHARVLDIRFAPRSRFERQICTILVDVTKFLISSVRGEEVLNMRRRRKVCFENERHARVLNIRFASRSRFERQICTILVDVTKFFDLKCER